jgi:hypothetical protein
VRRQLLEDIGYSPQQRGGRCRRGPSQRGRAGELPREYVERLRKENADRRKRAEELEGRNARLVAGLLRAEVVADGRLADPADLLDGTDATALLGRRRRPRPRKVKAAVTELLGREPYYAKWISGDVGQGARPGSADPNEELWNHPVQDALVVATSSLISYPDE